MTPEGLDALADVEKPSNPFPGLRPFEFGESHLYFGRDGQGDQLIRKLAVTRFVAVVGTSGSGKSSLVRAGLLPDLYGGFMPGAGSHWRVCLMRPSNDPLGNLALALNATDVFGSDDEENRQIQTAVTEATLRRGSLGLVEAVRQNRMASNESLLVVVDQFEELFRFARVSGSEQYRYEAAAFVKLLLEAARQRERNIYVVLTMRSDFLGDCSIFWGLPEAINEGQYLIPRMTRDQRAEAVTGPVAVCDGHIAQRLVNRLLNDTGDNPDMLPILQHALMRTWENWAADHAEGEPLDLRHYEAVGTMSDALSRHADEAWDELPDKRSRQIAERVFKALTEKGEDNREVRRPTVLGELCEQVGATTQEVASVVEVFRREGRSFLMPPSPVPLDEETLIDISHESLIRNWQRLKEWVDEESLSAQTYTRLAETAVLHERKQAGLWRDPDLQVALDWREQTRPTAAWATRYHPAFDPAMKFLDASVAARDAAALAEKEQRRREIRRTRIAAVVFCLLSLFSLLALAAFGYAYYKSVEAQTASTRNRQLLYAASIKLAQQAYDEGNLTYARELLGAHAPGGADALGFEWFYLWRLLHGEAETLNVGLRGRHKLQSAVLTGDGKTLFVDKGDGVELWDMASRRRLRSIDKDPALTATAISPDGRLIALGGEKSSAVRLVDANTGQEVQRLGDEREPENPDEAPEGAVSVLKFSPDSATLAVGTQLVSEKPTEVALWDVASRRRKAGFEATATITSIAFSPTGGTVAASQVLGRIEVRETTSGRLLCVYGRLGENISTVAFSGDGKVLAALSAGGKVYAWPAAAGCEQTVWFEVVGGSPISSFAFLPDDHLLAVSYQDSTIKLFTGIRYERALTEAAAFKGHGSYINSVVFLGDNRTLLTASEDGAVKLWDTSALVHEHKKLGGHTSGVEAVVFSPDGKRLATGGLDKSLRLWDAATRQPLPVKTPEEVGAIYAVAYSPDGRYLVTSADGGDKPSIQLWDANTLKELPPFDIKGEVVNSVAYSPDGRRLVSGASTLRLWDADSRALLKEVRRNVPIHAVAFSPDGRLIAAAERVALIELWDATLTNKLNSFVASRVSSLTFSPNGRVLAASLYDGGVKLWDTDTGAELATLSGHNGAVHAVAFSPDGRTLATGGGDTSVKLWSTASFKELVTLGGHTDAVMSVAFSPDGRTLASTGFDKTVRLWRAATDEEVRSRGSR
ncbi:MAG TPA: hypothetical protein VFZ44_14845 [Pyrinomonadaceae bacterium]